MQRCRRLSAQKAPARSPGRGERDRADGMALTIQIVAKRKPASTVSGEQSDRQPPSVCRLSLPASSTTKLTAGL